MSNLCSDLSPQGLKANMKRLYQLITEQQFSRCHKQEKYKKLLFSLCFFHSVLLERRKFLMLGWNIQYGFNDSDFEVSENLLSIYLDEYEETPWDALKYLVSLVLCGQSGLTGLLQVRKWSPKKKRS